MNKNKFMQKETETKEENKILTEKDMSKEVLEQITKQEEIVAELRPVHDGSAGIIMECFHGGKSIGNIGMNVDGKTFRYNGPLRRTWGKLVKVSFD